MNPKAKPVFKKNKRHERGQNLQVPSSHTFPALVAQIWLHSEHASEGGKILCLQPLDFYKSMPRNKGQNLVHYSLTFRGSQKKKKKKYCNSRTFQKEIPPIPWFFLYYGSSCQCFRTAKIIHVLHYSTLSRWLRKWLQKLWEKVINTA